ncbi:hypothetical protein [Lactococcus lactis]|uniref:hypothetical protein n=1 Tax=Lactococcus lactis TaxID=1358 RepID=UPI0024A8ADD9|nr:hypothetical protein [Lactococcus lactis]
MVQFGQWGGSNEKIYIFSRYHFKASFYGLAWYVYTNYSADNKMKWVGLSMVAFNIITMFFDSNYHKSKK